MRKRSGYWMLFFVLTGLLVFAWALVTQPLLPVARNDSAARAAPARLEAHVRRLAEIFIPRDEAHPQNLDRVAAYLRRAFERAGGRVSEQPYEVDGKTYRNVIARFGPNTEERIVIGAHYDSVAADVPGADDNASGVAGLIELARMLNKSRLAVRVELVAYTLEEGQHFRTQRMGSAVHVRSLQEQGVSVRAMFSLEMLGYFTDAPGSQRYPHPVLKPFYPSAGNFIAVVGKLDQPWIVRRVKAAMRSASPLPVYSINAPLWVPGVDFSDHRNYWDAGYDAVMITDTAFYRNPHYHTARDTPETLDYQRMAMVVQGVHAAVVALAQ
ncbi:MAG: M28 family peptidase [Gammaproteobacteria bacterium]